MSRLEEIQNKYKLIGEPGYSRLDDADVDYLIKAHEVMKEALEFYADGKDIDIIASGEEEFNGKNWCPLGFKAREALKKVEEI